MRFLRLAETSAALAATRSRLAKRRLIADLLREADPDELPLVATYLAGSLRQRRTGVGWASLADTPSPADEPTLTVRDVDGAFEAMAGLAGPGSASGRSTQVAALFARATESEQRLLRGLIFDEVRQGALEALVQEGIAEAFAVPPALVRRVAMMTGSTADAAVLVARDGAEAAAGLAISVGQPIRPMLAASAPDVSGALDKTGLPAFVDAKLDGIRVQVHRAATGSVAVYTRTLEEITERLPEIVDAVRALPVGSFVLDAEVLALDPAGRPLPFQVIASRTASRVDVAAGQAATPLSLHCFDLLHVDDRDVVDLPLTERRTLLTNLIPAAMVVPHTLATTVEAADACFADAVRAGYEGVIVKRPESPYAAGRRDAGWVKVKPRHTFDLAVTAAEWGHGRRQGWLSNLHLAARDPATGGLVMLGKTFKGLTDQLLAWQTEALLALESRRTAGTVYVDPPLVVEIACDGVQRSTRYPGGVALRFARVLRYRPDKPPAEIDSLDAVVALGAPAPSA